MHQLWMGTHIEFGARKKEAKNAWMAFRKQFDLKNAPQENRNEDGNPEYSITLERMLKLLKEQMAKAEDLTI